MMRFIGILLVIFAAIVGISFTVLNAQTVVINYYLGTREIPLALVVALAVAAGALLGVLGGVIKVSRVKKQARRLRRQLRSIEKEIVNLRPISMDDAN